MERMMRYFVWCFAIGLAALVGACSDTSGPTTTCGAGTQEINGECVTIAECGEGTINVDNTCVPATGATCGVGTVEGPGGLCVPAEGACEEGTHLDPEAGSCVPDFQVVCGAGTVLGPDDTCVPSEPVECGAGTQLVNNECVLIFGYCDPWEIFNPETQSCELDTTICGSGGAGGDGSGGLGGSAGTGGTAGSGGTAGTGGAAGAGGGSGSCFEGDIEGEPTIMGALSIFPESATFDDSVTVTVGVDGDTEEVTVHLDNANSGINAGSGSATTSGNETVQVDVLVGTVSDPGLHVAKLELRADASDRLNYILYEPGDGNTYVRIKVDNGVRGPETATPCLELNCDIQF